MRRYLSLACAALIGSSQLVAACDCETGCCKPAAKAATFTSCEAPSAEKVKAQAQEWLKSVGGDANKFEGVWSADTTVLDRVAKTIALGDAKAAKLLADAQDPNCPAPLAVPELITNKAQSAFYRANLGLAYAKALASRRVYEESLATLASVKPEECVEPATYFFHKAVAEHGLLKRDEAAQSITTLLDQASAPERYRLVGTLMLLDMNRWKTKDLGWIGRKMSNIERRLDLARGGPATQKEQREVLHRLDEMIKELEKTGKSSDCKCDKPGDKDGKPCDQDCDGSCPGSPKPGDKDCGGDPTSPMKDSKRANNGGPGNDGDKKIKEAAGQWGKLPEKEKAEVIADRVRDLPPHLRSIAAEYQNRLTRDSK